MLSLEIVIIVGGLYELTAWAMTFGKGSSKDLREGNCRPTTHGFVGCAVNIVDNPDQATGLHRIQPQGTSMSVLTHLWDRSPSGKYCHQPISRSLPFPLEPMVIVIAYDGTG